MWITRDNTILNDNYYQLELLAHRMISNVIEMNPLVWPKDLGN